MIPEHDENGNLPPGTYEVSFDEIIARFGGKLYLSRHRRTNNLIEFFDFIKGFALGMYVNGSYITTKLAPGDVDVMVILPEDFDFDSHEAKRLSRFQRNKKSAHLDLFVYVKGRHQAQIESLLEGWMKDIDRDDMPKGILYVEINR